METQTLEFIAAFVLGLMLLFILIRLFYTPLRIAFKLVLNAVAGGVLLMVINFAGTLAGISIGINVVTAAVTGVLGVPGIALLLLLQIVLRA